MSKTPQKRHKELFKEKHECSYNGFRAWAYRHYKLRLGDMSVNQLDSLVAEYKRPKVTFDVKWKVKRSSFRSWFESNYDLTMKDLKGATDDSIEPFIIEYREVRMQHVTSKSALWDMIHKLVHNIELETELALDEDEFEVYNMLLNKGAE